MFFYNSYERFWLILFKLGGALHGDMMQAERDKVLRDFKNNKFPIMVATDVAGM